MRCHWAVKLIRLEVDDYPKESVAAEAVVFDWGQARILKTLGFGLGHYTQIRVFVITENSTESGRFLCHHRRHGGVNL